MTKKLPLKNSIMKEIFQTLQGFSLLNALFSKMRLQVAIGLLFVYASTGTAQYISGDTSVCPGTTVNYNFSGGPWTIQLLNGGGTLLSPVGPSNSFMIAWGNVPGIYLMRLDNGIGGFYTQRVHVEGDYSLACDDLVNVSLNGNCQALITPDVMLEGELYPDDSYLVTVYNINNIPIPGNIVDYSHLGKTLKVHVRHLCSGVACWGRIYIEDKFIPELTCNPSPYIIACNRDYSPDTIGFPLPIGATHTPHPTHQQCFVVKNFDLCCDVELCYTDYYQKNGCNNYPYAQVERKWVATDCKGNKSTCTDSIYIIQATLANLVCPPNYDGFQRPPLQCDSIEYPFAPYPAGWNALDNGNPSPYDYYKDGKLIWRGTGVPAGVSCDHIAVTFRDIRIPVCGNSFKLLRNWKIFDWCTGTLTECVQFIKVTDERAPIVSCSRNYITFPTDYYECTGTATIPPPDLITDCSATSFTVEYKLAGPDGKPEAGDYRTDNISYQGGNAVITGLPQDTTWVQYVVTDACGNSTRCRIEVLIVDRLDPVAICDQHTVVSINDQGVGELFATSVNQGSYDNCELDSMAIRRMNDWCGISSNTTFGRYVTFCCEDLTRNPHMVVFRVWDKKGNFNDCMVQVTVQEKTPPAITCPNPITVDCGTDLSNLTLLGRATATNICSNTTITYRNDTLTWKCGTGLIRRRWTATTAGGISTFCDQYITVIDQNPVTSNSITWPADIIIDGCKAADAHPDFAGKPIPPAKTACSNLISGYTDERFYSVGGYCIKIIRHWRVIDWCLYDVNNPTNGGLFTRDQLIYLRNKVAPTLENSTCSAKEACANDLTCDGNIELIGRATDDCTDANKLIWSYRIDLNNDGSFGPSNPGNNASGTYPVGTHKVEWTVADSCANTATCNQLFTIRDCKAPIPICKVGAITVVMPSSKSITVPARTFDQKSEDNCTPQNLLRFSYSTNPIDSNRTFTCADIRNGIKDSVIVRMYITDLFGNQSYCDTKLFLQDGAQDSCKNKFTNGGIISGLVSTNNSSVLQNAHMDLFKSDVMFGSINSEKTGTFTFVDIPEGGNYKLTPNKNDDVANGISTADIVLIQKHILGVQKFASVYQYIAADVNNSKSITAADVSELRKLILGITDSFKDGVNSWAFVKNSMTFTDQENPWLNYPWDNQYELKDLQGVNASMDFMGIKMGDVNYSAKTTDLNTSSESRSGDRLILGLDKSNLTPAASVQIPVYGSWQTQLNGFQFALQFNSDYAQFIQLRSGELEINASNYKVIEGQNAQVLISWSSNVALKSTSKPLFYMEFKIVSPCNALQLLELNPNTLKSEAYDDQIHIMNIAIAQRGTDPNQLTCELYQNQPNPFSEQTQIGFQVPEKQLVALKVFDVRGNIILKKEFVAEKGKNKVTLQQQEIGRAGIYYYQLETDNFVGTRKLLLTN